ncbi:MAG: type II toxin-antitoxin system VapC family toxin [Candidatus Scalindua sp.]
MESVYIESTVISYYTARRTRDLIAAAHQEITIEWWENALPNFEPFISQIVLDEIERGDSDAAKMRCETAKDFKLIEVTEETVNLAEIYFKVLEIPNKAKADAFHMAISVLGGVDYLVTWNCTHIASARVRKAIGNINEDRGFVTPVICTPEELMEP